MTGPGEVKFCRMRRMLMQIAAVLRDETGVSAENGRTDIRA